MPRRAFVMLKRIASGAYIKPARYEWEFGPVVDQSRSKPEPQTGKETGAILLAIGGIAAALGVASCCALPMMLASFGIGSAWLFGIAVLSAPHRLALLTAAALCLIGAGVMLALRQRAIACAPGSVCGHRMVAPLVIVLAVVGAALTVAGYLYA